MKKTRKILCIFLAIFTVNPIMCMADTMQTFESQKESYGDRASDYSVSIPVNEDQITLIYCEGNNAKVGTKTNVRILPAPNSPKVGTIDTESKIKIWGFTENGWSKVFCTENGEEYFGYIRSDLLYDE